ncbi:MAG: hypothetical protein MR843_07835, partial [Bacteroidales bacterium]|nr:hypothetical protein [Bacteroidales bacterium]
GRDAILRVRSKYLIFNMVLKLWADVKYHVPTGFGFSPKASGFYPFGDRCEALASLKGCFLCFCFCAPSIYPLNRKMRKGIS